MLSKVAPADPVPPPLEIRTIMEQKCFWVPSFKFLEGLNSDDLNFYLKNIDPYAQYVPPISLPETKSRTLRLGIEVFDYKSILWIRPDVKGPADIAGLPEISKLIAINQIDVSNFELVEVASMLDMAVQQQQVMISVFDKSGEKAKSYKVQPADFPFNSLMWKRAGNRITIFIKEFVSHDTAPKFAALYRTVVNAKSEVVIDLRGCSGGDLFEAIEIAGMFVPPDLPLIVTRDRDGVELTYRAQLGQKLLNPVLLLMDHRTASAAEVLAAILKYYKITRLIGEPSAGKCLSQTIIPLSSGGDLWLTTLEIEFPNGSTCTGVGVDPDVVYPDIAVARLDDIIRKMDHK